MNLLEDVKSTYDKSLDIIAKKNQDYATGEDPFKNFRFSEMMGVDPQRAILVRISDKLARMSNLLDKPPAVVEENIEDTIIDAIGYLAILNALRKS